MRWSATLARAVTQNYPQPTCNRVATNSTVALPWVPSNDVRSAGTQKGWHMGILDNKVAIITGGASGFGRGTSVLWAKEGARVCIADVNEEAGASTLDEIRASGGKAIFQRTDVSKAEDAERLVAATVKEFGKLDVLFNNAAILGPRNLHTEDFGVEDAMTLLSVNIMGVFLPTKYALPAMVKSGGGSIVTTGSDAAFRGNTKAAVYSATKSAAVAFTRVVAMEYVDRNIRANVVSPGVGRTPMHGEILQSSGFREVEQLIPMKRAAEPNDIARAALFFASDLSAYVTGQNLMVDGGWTARGYT